MSKPTIRTLISLMAFMSICSVAQSQSIGAANIGDVINTYKDNQARFAAKYRGKSFSSQSIFNGAIENTFVKGIFMGKFNVQGKELNCSFSLKADVDRLVDLNKGERVLLEGLIDDVTMGDLQLKSCKFRKQ